MKKILLALLLLLIAEISTTSAASDEWHISDTDHSASITLYESQTNIHQEGWTSPDFNFSKIRNVIIFDVDFTNLNSPLPDNLQQILQEEYRKSAKRKNYKLWNIDELKKAIEKSSYDAVIKNFSVNDIKVSVDITEWQGSKDSSMISVKFKAYNLHDELIATREYVGEGNESGKQQVLFKQICKYFFKDIEKKIHSK